MPENPPPLDLETDPRFPSGKWGGYFLQKQLPGRHRMELLLTFRNGELTGEGRDLVGFFYLRGRYSLADGVCSWNKRYLGKHDVQYRGFAEGNGIWGTWEIPPSMNEGRHWRGGFHIWPEGQGGTSGPALAEEADLPEPATV